MKTFETVATVKGRGEIHVEGVPFQHGTQVRVIIAPQRVSGEEFARVWTNLCREIRERPTIREITDEEIQQEIDDHRSGR